MPKLTKHEDQVLFALGLRAGACPPTPEIIARVCGLSLEEAAEALCGIERKGLATGPSDPAEQS